MRSSPMKMMPTRLKTVSTYHMIFITAFPVLKIHLKISDSLNKNWKLAVAANKSGEALTNGEGEPPAGGSGVIATESSAVAKPANANVIAGTSHTHERMFRALVFETDAELLVRGLRDSWDNLSKFEQEASKSVVYIIFFHLFQVRTCVFTCMAIEECTVFDTLLPACHGNI
jgi:hypothetical protein